MSVEERLQSLVGCLVASPDSVAVSTVDRNGRDAFLVTVADEDRGAVLGRQGSTIQALEVLMRAVCSAQGLAPRGIELNDGGRQKENG